MSDSRRPPLRAITFLAPGIPAELFRLVTDQLARSFDYEPRLEVESRSSGPMHGDADPFAEGRADVGFLCSPSYLFLRAKSEPSVELVPAAFVFRDPRHHGEPVYYSDVVVRADHPAEAFVDLAGGAWGYNDECSLSGYFATLQKLAEIGCNGTFFARRVRTGSHLASIESTLSGDIDAAAIDSTVLARCLRERPELGQRIRVLESWGPFPIQPIVVRAELAASWGARLADALLNLGDDSNGDLSRFGLDRCVSIGDNAYEQERRELRALGHLPA